MQVLQPNAADIGQEVGYTWTSHQSTTGPTQASLRHAQKSGHFPQLLRRGCMSGWPYCTWECKCLQIVFPALHPIAADIFQSGQSDTAMYFCERQPKYLHWYASKAPPSLHLSSGISICSLLTLVSLSLSESTISGKIPNAGTEEPMTSWSHKYYVLCFPHCCLMFHIEVGTIKQTAAHKRMGPLIPSGIILVEGVFSTGPARESY